MPRRARLGAATLAAALCLQTVPAHSLRFDGSLSRYVDSLAAAKPAPRVSIDVRSAPEAGAWARKAAELVRDWFPLVCGLLATEDYRPPRGIRLVLKPDIDAPAYAGGDEITINARWIAQHPDDFGMVIHEMTHVIQHYPGGGDKPGWLVEGIADYIRWWRYEPEAPRPRVDPDRAGYTDSYRTTAAFLAWAVYRYDRGLVRKLDGALRERKYRPSLFEEATGKTLDALWTEYVDGLRRAAR